jgi:hypothetical protein
MGLMLSRILQVALGFANGGTLIAMAAGGTGAIFVALAAVASTTKRDFSNLGKFLFSGVILLLVAIVANIFFQIPALSLAISAIAVVIFSAYILYDINRIVHGGETNYITATLAVYLDIYNVFVSLLQPADGIYRRARLTTRKIGAGGTAQDDQNGDCGRRFTFRSNSAMDSRWDVCGNMLAIPARTKR